MSDAPNQPQYGDPEILPRGTIVRPSAERMPFTLSGELKPDGPELPADFLLAPDVAGLPWVRRRGDEWTDAAVRADVLAWLVVFLDAHAWARGWQITERATGLRMSRRLDVPVLIIQITDTDGATHEVGQTFPTGARSGALLAERLDQVRVSLEALHP